jgi:DNA-binding transcriptional ArsR family regulator
MDKPIRYYELHAEVCKTFGHPKRLMVITTLRKNELTVTEIADETNICKALDLMSSFLEQRITSSHDLIKE